MFLRWLNSKFEGDEKIYLMFVLTGTFIVLTVAEVLGMV